MFEHEELVKTNNDTKATTNNGNKSSSTQHISIDINNDEIELNMPMLSKDETEKKSENLTSSRNKVIKVSATAIIVAVGLGIVRYVKSILLSPPSLWDSCLDELPVTERNEFKEDMTLINEANNPTVYPPVSTRKEAEAELGMYIFAGLPSLTGGIANSANQMEATAGYLSPNDGMVLFDSGKNTRNTKGRRDLHNGNSVHSTPDSVHSLTTISQKVGSELDEQEPEHRQEVQSDQSSFQEQNNLDNINTSFLYNINFNLNETQWENYYKTFDDPKSRDVFDVALEDYLSENDIYDKEKNDLYKRINELEREKKKIDKNIEPNPDILVQENKLKKLDDMIKKINNKLEKLNIFMKDEKSSYKNYKSIISKIDYPIYIRSNDSNGNVEYIPDIINSLIDEINGVTTNINDGETDFLIDNETKLDLIYGIIHYCRYFELLTNSYQRVLLNVDKINEEIINKIEEHRISNDYLDILKTNEISSFIQQQKDYQNITVTISDELSEENYLEVTLLNAIVYWMMINKYFNINMLKDISVYTVLKKYLTDQRQYNPMMKISTLPEGYYSFYDFERRRDFDTQKEFTTQFNKYKDKYSNYEANILTKQHLSSLDLGVTAMEIVTSPKRVFSFSITSHIGKVNMLELASGNWLLISFIDGGIKMKKYTQEEINNNNFLKALVNPNTGFNSELIYAREVARNVMTNKKIFPGGRLGNIKDSDGSSSNKNYQQFWHDFYENKINITEPIFYIDKPDREFPEKFNTFDIIENLLKEGLDNISDNSKIILDDASFLHTVATMVIPFYGVIYEEVTDSHHSLDTNDVVSIVFDSISVIITVMTLGLSISSQVLPKITTKTAELSLKYSGRALLRAVIRELPSMKLLNAGQVSRLLASGIIDLIEPFPIRDIFRGTYGTYKGLKKSSFLKKGSQVQNKAVIEKTGVYIGKSQDMVKMPVNYSGLGHSNPVRDAARTSMLSGSSQDVCWSFATDVLQKAKVVTDTQAQILIDGLKKAAQYKGISNSGRIDDLFEGPRKITNIEQLLRVKEGEMLVFMEVDPNMPNKGARPVHVVASIGNGRFAGMKNSALNNSLGDGKKIITAEQLGQFEGEGLRRYGSASPPLLDIYAGYPVGAQARYGKPIKEVAQSLTSSGQAGDIGKFISDLLEQSGELAFEQASAFNDVVKALLDPNNVQRTVNHLLTNKRNINNIADLTTLSKGSVVVFQESEYSVKNLMVSLGEGEFAIFNPENLGSSFNHADTVVASSQFGEFSNGKLGAYTVVAGQVNVNSMRKSALLGKDSLFVLKGNKLHIKVHGAPGIVNYMDAIEFSDVVRGLSLRTGDVINFKMVGAIEFQSCYGAFGKQSSGQILADKLRKKVTAYPLKYSGAIAQNPEWWRPRPKIFEPRTLNAGDAGELDRAHKQHMKNHNFWEKLLGLYKGGPSLRRSKREVNLIASSFELLIDDVADLALNKFTVDDFLRLHPEYFGKKNDLYTVMQTELASLIKLAAPTNADSFAELCIAILSLNQFSFDLLDNYLSDNV
ncbi:hypothetical protein [Photorhabdus sp. RM71S]|uniref:hypothetical protein n=1 Tax=Photorhabdus sp. RM71S TaxID=3342824 RepID=UPI0036DBB6A0